MEAVDAALLDGDPPPIALQRYIVAVGLGDVRGFGAEAVYGPGQFDLYTFNEVYSIQQRVMVLTAEDGRDSAQRDRAIRRTIRLEDTGYLDLDHAYSPFESDELPFDPGA